MINNAVVVDFVVVFLNMSGGTLIAALTDAFTAPASAQSWLKDDAAAAADDDVCRTLTFRREYSMAAKPTINQYISLIVHSDKCIEVLRSGAETSDTSLRKQYASWALMYVVAKVLAIDKPVIVYTGCSSTMIPKTTFRVTSADGSMWIKTKPDGDLFKTTADGDTAAKTSLRGHFVEERFKWLTCKDYDEDIWVYMPVNYKQSKKGAGGPKNDDCLQSNVKQQHSMANLIRDNFMANKSWEAMHCELPMLQFMEIVDDDDDSFPVSIVANIGSNCSVEISQCAPSQDLFLQGKSSEVERRSAKALALFVKSVPTKEITAIYSKCPSTLFADDSDEVLYNAVIASDNRGEWVKLAINKSKNINVKSSCCKLVNVKIITQHWDNVKAALREDFGECKSLWLYVPAGADKQPTATTAHAGTATSSGSTTNPSSSHNHIPGINGFMDSLANAYKNWVVVIGQPFIIGGFQRMSFTSRSGHATFKDEMVKIDAVIRSPHLVELITCSTKSNNANANKCAAEHFALKCSKVLGQGVLFTNKATVLLAGTKSSSANWACATRRGIWLKVETASPKNITAIDISAALPGDSAGNNDNVVKEWCKSRLSFVSDFTNLKSALPVVWVFVPFADAKNDDELDSVISSCVVDDGAAQKHADKVKADKAKADKEKADKEKADKAKAAQEKADKEKADKKKQPKGGKEKGIAKSGPKRRRGGSTKSRAEIVLYATSEPGVRRLARRGGVKRISALCYDEVRANFERLLEDILRDTITFTDHVNRRTVTVGDVLNGLNVAKQPIYGF